MTKTEDKVKVCYRNTTKGNKDVESRWYELVVSSVALKGACVNTEYFSVLLNCPVGFWFITPVSGLINDACFTNAEATQ